MAISDKEAFRILDLPLGVDKDAILNRYRSLSAKLAGSKLAEDAKKLEKVIQAFHQLLPPSQNKCRLNNLPGREDGLDSESAIHALQRRAERKKEKKKRKKERRKNYERTNDNKFFTNNGKIGGDDSESSSCGADPDEEPLDINSAFAMCGGRKSVLACSNGAAQHRKEDNTKIDPEMLRNRQMQARSMAVQGNEAAAQGLHQKAVKLFTQAAACDPTDHRFLGNRSFCYEQLKLYDKALSDADKAIELASQWPKGYFRKGRALLGLGRFSDAEKAFNRVLELDPDCREAQEEISNVLCTRLTDMGFTSDQAATAIAKYRFVDPALDALLAGEFSEQSSPIYFPDSEEVVTDSNEAVRVVISVPKKAASQQSDDIKMNPKNPQGLTSLWVGNVLPEVTEKELQKLFSKYGHVSSVRQLKEKFCAFVNFNEPNSAGRAMTGLQGHVVGGQRLLIKFPDNPITTNGPPGAVRRRNAAGSSRQTGICSDTSSTCSSLGDEEVLTSSRKPRGPVAGDECYFWRTTGCFYDTNCRYRHVLEHKGVDRKPWQQPMSEN